MATLNDSIELEGPFDDFEEIFSRLGRFYDANGYEVVEEIVDDEGLVQRVKFARGEEGNGWWSSDMSDLYAKVDVTRTREGGCLILYVVDVTGQRLSEEDKAFWARERELVEAFLTDDSPGEPEDLRVAEASRAKKRFNKTLVTSIKGSFTAFVLLAILMIMLHRLGLVQI